MAHPNRRQPKKRPSTRTASERTASERTASARPASSRGAAVIAEQERRARRRQYLVIGVVAAVLALVGGLTWYATSVDSTGEAAVAPRGATEDYGIVVGDPAAPTTITIYEDLQCPVCALLEAEVGEPLAAAVEAGQVKVDYRIVSFLDDASTNEYSSRAANAAAVVRDVAGAEAFAEFHDLLFADQPPEGGAGHTDEELIEYAVRAGAEDAAVRGPVQDKAFEQWVVNATDAMSRAGVTGTPTVFIDGERAGETPQESIEAILAQVG